MRGNDPFAPLSRTKKIRFTTAGVVIVVGAAVLLGGMDGGFSAWELLRVMIIAGIPVLAMLAIAAWLSGGKRSEAGVGPRKVKFPIRFLKAIPYMVGIIALFYFVKAIEAFQSR